MSCAWFSPRTMEEALQVLATRSPVTPLAGGTDLMVGLRSMQHAEAYVSLDRLAELRGVRVQPEGLWLGATTTLAEVGWHPMVQAQFPLLAASARLTGAVAIQNRATIGGNIMNASPAADNPPVLLAYGASVVLASVREVRTIPYEQFHVDYKKTVCQPDELLTGIFVPYPSPGSHQYFRKVATRSAQAISKVTLAAVLKAGDGAWETARFGLASVGPTPILADTLSRCLKKEPGVPPADEVLAAALFSDISPRDDIRSSGSYRRQVAFNLIREALGPWRQSGDLYANHAPSQIF